MRSFSIRSTHRTSALALRHATKLRRDFSGDVTVYRKNSSGKFSKRGTSYTFVVTPHKRKMYRIIVGYPYLVNVKKGRSPDARTMKAVYYGKTKADVTSEKSRLRKAALHEAKKVSKAWIQDKRSHPLYRKVNVQVSQVEYDVRFIGITEFLDD
jgi:hypothetical protein